jgi:hypothetical protein
MALHRFIVVGVLLAGCSTPASYEGADFPHRRNAACSARPATAAAWRRMTLLGSRQSNCEQQVVPAPDKRCKDVDNPDLRRACELKTHDCTLRAPMMSCGERRDTCMSSCG